MGNNYPLLMKDIKESPVVMLGNYPYLVLKIGNGIPYIEAALLREIANGLMNLCNFDVDRIVCPEPMGTYLGAIISYLSGVKVTFARRMRFELPDEIEIELETKYDKPNLYLSGLRVNEEVTVIDDVVSSGATLISIINSLVKAGLRVKDVGAVVAKDNGVENVKRRTGLEVKYLARVKVSKDGRVHLV